MEHVHLRKHPAMKGETVKGGIRSYLKRYGLLLQRVKWYSGGSKVLPEDNIKRDISNLINPIAFEAGKTEIVQNIETELDTIFSDKKQWNGEPFKVKTCVREAGSNGWFIFKGSKAELLTTASFGREDTSTVDGRYIKLPIPENEEVVTKAHLSNLKDSFVRLNSDPQNGDVFEIGFKPTEDRCFSICFNFERNS